MSKIISNLLKTLNAENRPPQNRTIMRSYITSKWDQQKTRVIPKIALIEAALNRSLAVVPRNSKSMTFIYHAMHFHG